MYGFSELWLFCSLLLVISDIRLGAFTSRKKKQKLNHMEEYPEEYPMVGRTAIVVVPQKPFLDWLNDKYPSYLETLESLQQDSNIYLLPEADFPSMQSAVEETMELYIRKNCRSIFYNELFEWHTDEASYPPLNYKNFLKWFKISYHTVIYDMINKPIKKG
jgi:hypothetical protein